jgi:hypothetical protein
MSDEDLRKIALAATPGPYKACSANQGRCSCMYVWSIPADRPVAHADAGDDGAGRHEDVAYMAATSPDVVIGLLDRIAAAEGFAFNEAQAKAELLLEVAAFQIKPEGVINEHWQLIDRCYKRNIGNRQLVVMGCVWMLCVDGDFLTNTSAKNLCESPRAAMRAAEEAARVLNWLPEVTS